MCVRIENLTTVLCMRWQIHVCVIVCFFDTRSTIPALMCVQSGQICPLNGPYFNHYAYYVRSQTW